MNKGIIMEVSKNYAITMNDEGVMDKIVFKDNMKVGQKIFYFEDDIVKNTSNNIYRYHNFIKSFGSIAALFLIVFTFFHIMKPQEAYAIVSLDVNPSIQIEADSKLNIIKVEGVNDDGKKMDFSDIKNIPLESGIQKIKDKLVENNYLANNNEVLVGYAFVQNQKDNSDYEKDLMGAINSTFSAEQVTFVPAEKEDVDKAKEQGISLGRYEAASRVADQDIKDKIGTAPVKDITASIKDSETSTEWNTKENAANTNEIPEVKTEKPAIDKHEPNAYSDTAESSSDSVKGNKDNIANKSDNSDEVINLQPDEPVQSDNNSSSNNGNSNNGNGSNNSGNNSSSNSGNNSSSGGSSILPSTQKDNTINVAPNNGTTQNNTASGKINEGSNNQDTNKEVAPNPLKSEDKNIKN